MATATMPERRSRPTVTDPTARDIIAAGRKAPAAFRPALLLSLTTAFALWASFTPVDFGPLAWVALLPLLQLVRLSRPTRGMWWACYLGGLAFWLPALQWMRLGDSTMYVAWLALSFYLALYFPVFVALTRRAVWNWKWPFLLAVPVMWTGLEYARAHLMTGFGWYQLGHTQYRWLNLIQIADIIGTYGISFLVTLVAAACAELIPVTRLQHWKLLPPTTGEATAGTALPVPTERVRGWNVALAVGLCGLCVVYGAIRRGQARFVAGPRVAAVQGNFPASAHPTEDPNLTDAAIYRRHLELTGRAVKMQPDVILWPEGMLPYPLFMRPANVSDEQLAAWVPEIPPQRWRDTQLQQILTTISAQARAMLIVGGNRLTATPEGIRPYNSAFGFQPSGYVDAYDKQHLVPYGEYVPLKDWLAFLGNLTPYRGNFGVEIGQRAVPFDAAYGSLNANPRAIARLTPIICYEDTVPHVARRVVREASRLPDAKTNTVRPVEILVNLTNDGWFKGSSEHDQHLITALFRCVELRKPMVRAVNTGVSAIIDGDGVVRTKAVDPESKRSKWTEAVICDYVPLDNRSSLYLAGGDWFAGLCSLACAAAVGHGLFGRWLRRKPVPAPAQPVA